MSAQRERLLFNPAIYPIWGPIALWLNVRLYGHRYTGDNWTSRLWKKTRWGRRGLARRHERNAARQVRRAVR